MIEDLLKTIAKTLNDQYGGRAYYVGGYVRDLILNRANKDIDIEVHGVEANQLEKTLSLFGTVKHVGKSYGIFLFTAEIDGEKFKVDFSLPCQKFNGQSVYSPYIGLNRSLLRRDLTMNAMMMDVLTSEIYDPYNGQKDIQNKVLRYVNPRTFTNDPLRVYRVARFGAQLSFAIDPVLMNLCKSIDTTQVACERVFNETNKALLSFNPRRYFDVLLEMERLNDFFPAITRQYGLGTEKPFEWENLYEHTMNCLNVAKRVKCYASNKLWFMWSILLQDAWMSRFMDESCKKHKPIGDLTVDELHRLTNDKALSKYMLIIGRARFYAKKAYTEMNSKSFELQILNTGFADDILLAEYCRMKVESGVVDEPLLRSYIDWAQKLYAKYEQFLNETKILNGKDLIKLGIPANKDMKKYLNKAKRLAYYGVPEEQIKERCVLAYQTRERQKLQQQNKKDEG